MGLTLPPPDDDPNQTFSENVEVLIRINPFNPNFDKPILKSHHPMMIHYLVFGIGGGPPSFLLLMLKAG